MTNLLIPTAAARPAAPLPGAGRADDFLHVTSQSGRHALITRAVIDSRTVQALPDRLFRAFYNVLRHSRENELGGIDIPCFEDLVFRLRMTRSRPTSSFSNC